MELKEDNTIITGNFNSSSSTIDRSLGQKNSKQMIQLTYTIGQTTLILSREHLTAQLQNTHSFHQCLVLGPLSRINHIIISYVKPQNKCQQIKKIEIIPTVFQIIWNEAGN